MQSAKVVEMDPRAKDVPINADDILLQLAADSFAHGAQEVGTDSLSFE